MTTQVRHDESEHRCHPDAARLPDRSITDFSERYADQNDRDYKVFADAIRSGRLQAVEGVGDAIGRAPKGERYATRCAEWLARIDLGGRL